MAQVPLTIFSLVPSNMINFYVKYNLALESWTVTESIVLVTALLGGIVCVPITVRLARRLGKGRALSILLLGVSVFMLGFTFVPYTAARAAMWGLILPMGFVVGLGTTLAFGLPDAILADIIDYDELRTGDR